MKKLIVLIFIFMANLSYAQVDGGITSTDCTTVTVNDPKGVSASYTKGDLDPKISVLEENLRRLYQEIQETDYKLMLFTPLKDNINSCIRQLSKTETNSVAP